VNKQLHQSQVQPSCSKNLPGSLHIGLVVFVSISESHNDACTKPQSFYVGVCLTRILNPFLSVSVGVVDKVCFSDQAMTESQSSTAWEDSAQQLRRILSILRRLQ
jgi:hypothetical protein